MEKKDSKKEHHLTAEDEDRLFHEAQTIAVVGLSEKEDRPSHQVAKYLQKHGFLIVPVNPNASEVLGEKAYGSLRDVPVKIDIVDIFRKPEAVGAVVDEAIQIGAKVIWMQEGVVNEEAAKRAEEAGLRVEMDRCLMKEHQKFKHSS